MSSSRLKAAIEVPGPALGLGAAGLIPFVAGVLLGLFGDGPVADEALEALRFYGACILSFMGGIHWGLASHAAASAATLARLGPSTGPALIAWSALLLPPAGGFVVLAIAFAGLLAYDLRATRHGHAPDWYPRLRVPLTAIVVLCLLLAPLA